MRSFSTISRKVSDSVGIVRGRACMTRVASPASSSSRKPQGSVLQVSVTEWWVSIRTKGAHVGWVGWSRETTKFDHIDACE